MNATYPKVSAEGHQWIRWCLWASALFLVIWGIKIAIADPEIVASADKIRDTFMAYDTPGRIGYAWGMVIAFSLMLISAVLMCKAMRGNFTLRGGAVIVIGWIGSIAIVSMALLLVNISLLA